MFVISLSYASLEALYHPSFIIKTNSKLRELVYKVIPRFKMAVKVGVDAIQEKRKAAAAAGDVASSQSRDDATSPSTDPEE